MADAAGHDAAHDAGARPASAQAVRPTLVIDSRRLAEGRPPTIAELDAAVRAYTAACKADGLPPERVLLRVTDFTRRHLRACRLAPDGARLRGVAFRAFLVAYYGGDRAAGGGGVGATPGSHAPRARRARHRGAGPP